jgi:hypothetical protein
MSTTTAPGMAPAAEPNPEQLGRFGERWKKRLPDLLATLEALARARCENSLWRGA